MDTISVQGSKMVKTQLDATSDSRTLGHCVHALFEHAADTYADRTALSCAMKGLSYRGLNLRANRLARLLVKRGIGRGDLVVVALDRSLDLIPALLAVLKAGAAYVPIDPSYPLERIRQVMDDAQPKLIVTRHAICDALSLWKELFLNIDEAQDNSTVDTSNLQTNVQTGDLAYVIYTSGSTGKPKGVEVTHGAVSNLLCSMRHNLGCEEGDRLLAVTTISFDIAVLELFLPLICGAMTVIAQEHEVSDAGALLGSIEHHSISIMQGTPATWQLLLDSGWCGTPRLNKILCGGEALPRRLADRLLVCGDAVWNMYGPTETTVWVSMWRVCHGDEVIVGSPIANTHLYVLDADLSPVPLGSTGELYVGGAGVARGYHNNPELTRSRFLDNPFHPGILYRTGDLARFIAPGKLTVLGRTDDQVKIRGYRIELGDIEAAITDHDSISRALVVNRDDRLVAYCVRKSGHAVEEAQARSVSEWASAWDHVYGIESHDAILNLAGWRNSYDGQSFSTEEMRDWQTSSVRRILSYCPKRVVEIGSGSGLMLFSIAPHCRVYHAMDASLQAVEFTRQHLGSLPHVLCEHRQAHDLPVVEDSFDTVVVNSVVQYFPSIDYLVSLLKWATNAVDRGRIYLGDVRNLQLLEIFHADVLHFRTNGQISPAELARRATEAARNERELIISPEFFANIPTIFPRITRVDITLRDGCYDNEMTRYRFDVVLHIGKSNDAPMRVKEMNWQDEKLDLASPQDKLAVPEGTTLRLNNIPNGRLRDVHNRVGAAQERSARPDSSWVDPQIFKEIVTGLGLETALLPSRSGGIWSFDAMLWRAGDTPDLSLYPPKAMNTTFAEYANMPKAGKAPKPALGHLIGPWLAERLPAYMVPAFFVELDEFPLTLNGKIDRQALPDPLARSKVVDRPDNELERDILAIWCHVLGHDQIGINDNFFEVGGDSLRVVRVQTELEKLVQRPVLSAKLFEYYTIKTLARYLVNNPDQRSPEPGPMLSPVQRGEGIAIISMACRLPGGITTPEEYWELLDNGVDTITDVPKDRWDADAIYDADPQARGKSYCRRGGFISSIDSFDAAFFGISPREARSLDPAQCTMLETCWEGLERAGYSSKQLRGSPTGVFIGISNIPAYHNITPATKGLDDLDGYAGTGSAGSTMSGRISYTLGLEGPALTVDTACSASLVATHLACTALRQGECDMAVSGGVSLMLSPGVHVEFSRLQGMAPDGQCRPFSADTQGTSWSEGAAAIVLKRLSDALRDNDPILAVLPGTSVNHGGRSASLTTPSGPAQKRLIYTALAASNLQPSDIDYIEAHGTGTKLGDPIEGAALAEVFGNRNCAEPLWIGSAKSNVGHTQAAAGLVGLLKVVLAMQHSVLPQTLHIGKPTPAVDWKGANMAPVQRKRPWRHQKHRLRRAGVSAFGIGGTNAHAIVEECPPRPTVQPHASAPIPRAMPFLLSATTDAALHQQAEKLRFHLSRSTDHLCDVAYSLATSRNHFQRRLVLIAQDKEELLEKLAATTNKGRSPPGVQTIGPHLAMLFTGQGSQWSGMGRDLARHYPVFREALDEIAGHFPELERSLLEVMWADTDPDGAAALLQRTDYAQVALFAFEVALWRLWASWGVFPELLLGHSIGELAAAHIAGVMQLSDACRLVAARGRLMQALQGQGRMMSLEASAAEIIAAINTLGLSNEVAIAAHNTPTQTVASGNVDAVEILGAHFAAQGRKCKMLNVSQAFHSHHMDGMLADFSAIAETVQFHPPKIPIVSGLTGQLAAPGQLEQPSYWVQQARHAVRFSEGVQTLVKHGITIALELGPRPVLSGMGAACLAHSETLSGNVISVAWLPSVVAQKDNTSTIQRSLAELHMRHVAINWGAFFTPFGCQRVELPTYAFQREPIQVTTRPPQWQTGTSTTSQNNAINQLTERPTRSWDLHHALTVAAPDQHTEIVLGMVREIVAEILGVAWPDKIDMELPLQDLGIDSFTAVLMHNQLSVRTGLDLSAVFVFDHASLRGLCQSLLDQLQENWSEVNSTTSTFGGQTPGTTASDSASRGSFDDVLTGDSLPATVDKSEVTDGKCHSNTFSVASLHRVFCPSIGLNPPGSPLHLFKSALGYFSGLPWCHRLIYDQSPTSSLLPGYGQAIPFIPQCFNPASPENEQFIGGSLSHSKDGTITTPSIRHVLSLFRPADATQLEDPCRHIPRVTSLFALGSGTSGHRGMLHGGLTATLLDESISIVHEINAALGKTESVFSSINVTASLTIRYLAPVATTEPAVCVTAWVEAIQGRNTRVKAELTNSTGERLAEAEGVFVAKSAE